MTITHHQAKELKKRIKALVHSELTHAHWQAEGSQPPYDTAEHLRIATKRINELINDLRLPDGRISP